MSTTLTATFLFVDVVGSTDLLHRLGDDANDELRARYAPVLTDAVIRHGGTEVKGLGDGLMAAFPDSTAEAVAAAIDMQVGVDRLFRADPLLRIQLRIGLSVGEAVYHQQDWSGVPVVEAARLEAAALPGTILANDLIRGVVGTRGGFEFVPVGERQLKGFPDPLRCVEVVWESPDILPEVPLSAELTDRGGPPLVGRTAELDTLLDAWKEASHRRSPEWVALVGAAGSGTSRLAVELASVAHSDRSTVLYGRCEESPSAPIGPWAQMLRWWASSVPLDLLRDVVADRGPALLSVAPTLAARLPELPAERLPTSHTALTDAAVATLAGIARSNPLLVVLDQVQLADGPTRDVLDRLLAVGDLPLLVVTIERVDEDSAALVGAPVSVRLGALDTSSVHDLLEAVFRSHDAGSSVTRELASRVFRETGGSPREVVEVAERLISSGAFELSGSDHDEAVRSALVATSPYKGLLSYQEDDADLYFGRSDHIAALLARLASTRFLVVTGASGSGKSSLVRAGLLPALARGSLAGSELWHTVVFTPGARPLTELAWALSSIGGGRISDVLSSLEAGTSGVAAILDDLARTDPDGRIVLVVDQFEELFTQGASDDEVRRFVDAILRAAAPEGHIMVVAVVRADFYGHSASIPGLGGAFEMSTFVVGPMDDEAIRSVIQGPAAAAGLRLEPGLVDLMVRDVAAEPGALALLSHALYETWKRREGRELTVAGYRDAGGVRGAIARTAEGIFATRLDAHRQHLAREVFLRLTEPGEGTEDTRRRAPRGELEALADSPDDLAGLLEELAAARLVTVSSDSVDVAHEALIREWPRLRGWLDEDRAHLRTLRHLTHAASEWDDGGRDPTDLYGAARLEAATAAAERTRVTELEQEFLDASHEAIELGERREQRHQRRLRRALVAACLALVATIGFGVIAGFLWEQADDEADDAELFAEDANLQRLISQAQSLRTSDREVAHLLAVEAFDHVKQLERTGELDVLELWPDQVQTRSALLAALQADRHLLARVPIERGAWGSTMIGEDLLAYGAHDGRVRFVDLGADPSSADPASVVAVPLGDVTPGRTTRVFVAEDPLRRPGDPVVAARADDGRIWRLDPRTKAVNGAPMDAAQGLLGVAASGRLDLVAAALADSSVQLWRLSTGEHLGAIVPAASNAGIRPEVARRRTGDSIPAIGPSDVDALAFSPIADELLVQRPGGWLQRFDTATLSAVSDSFGGAQLASSPEPGHLAYTPDGSAVAAYDAASPRQQRIVDLATGWTRWAVRNEYVPAAFLSAEEMVTLDEKGRLVVLDVRDGRLRRVVSDTQLGSGATGVHVAQDGGTATVVSERHRRVGSWSLRGGGPLSTVTADGPAVPIEVGPDGTRVLARSGDPGSPDTRLSLWESPSGELVADDLPMTSAVFTESDDRLLGLFVHDRKLHFYDVGTAEESDALPIPTSGFPVFGVAPNGMIVVGRMDGSVEFFYETGRAAFDPVEVEGQVTALRFSPDDRVMVLAGDVVSVFDLSTGRLVGPRIDDVRSATFVPDTERLLVVRADRRLQLIDPATGNVVLRPVPGPASEVASVEVSPKGEWMQLTTSVGDVQLYGRPSKDLEALAKARGERVADMPVGLAVPTIRRSQARFSPDSEHLVVGGEFGLEFWDLDEDRWRQASCQLAGRNLDRQEWPRYMPNAGSRKPTCEQWPL